MTRCRRITLHKLRSLSRTMKIERIHSDCQLMLYEADRLRRRLRCYLVCIEKLKKESLTDESVKRRTELLKRYILPHKNLIYKMCIQFTWNKWDIEDNYNEVLTNFFRYIESYNPERPVKTWIYAVTKRLLADLNSRNQNRLPPRENVKVQDIAGFVPEADTPGENWLGLENYQEHYSDSILKALDQLKPVYREALLLQQAGYKLREIVEITYRNGSLRNKNIETVKSRLFLAKSQMRKLLSQDGKTGLE